ncbi:MAG: hypothetical protein WCK67_06090 [bacterium]
MNSNLYSRMYNPMVTQQKKVTFKGASEELELNTKEPPEKNKDMEITHKGSTSAAFGENAANFIKIGASGYVLGAGLQFFAGQMPSTPANTPFIPNIQPNNPTTIVQNTNIKNTDPMSAIYHMQAKEMISTLGNILETGGWTAMNIGALGLKGCQFATFGKENKQPTAALGGLALVLDTPLMILLPHSVAPKAAMYLSIAAINAGYANFARNEHIEKEAKPREFDFDYLFDPQVYKRTFEFLKDPFDKESQKEILEDLNKTKELAQFMLEDEAKVIHAPVKLLRQTAECIKAERNKPPTAVDIADIDDPKSMSKTFRELKRWSSMVTQIGGGMLMYTAVIPSNEVKLAANIAATVGTVMDCGGIWVKSSEKDPKEKMLLISGILTKTAGSLFAGINNDALVVRNIGDSILLSELYAKQAQDAAQKN